MRENWSDLRKLIEREIEEVEHRLSMLKKAHADLAGLTKRKRAKTSPTKPSDLKVPRSENSSATPKKLTKTSKKSKSTTKGVTGRVLPATGAAFWLGILGDGAHTGREIVDAAMVSLNLNGSARAAIYSRAANWFNGAVKKSLVTITGQRDGVNVYQRVA